MAKKLNRGYDPHPVDQEDKLLEEKRTIKSSSKDDSSPNIKGCPENDYKEHVYAHILTIFSWPGTDKPDQESHSVGPCMGCGHKRRGLRYVRPTGEPDEIKRLKFYRNEWRFKQ